MVPITTDALLSRLAIALRVTSRVALECANHLAVHSSRSRWQPLVNISEALNGMANDVHVLMELEEQ